MRKATSLTAALSFIALIVSSVILYIVPHGRVAYWADWHMWGLTKTQWGDMHINTGVLFCLAAFLHIYYNWKAMMSYMKKSQSFKVFTKDFNIALALTLVTIAGTYFMLPPFSWVLNMGERIKEIGSEKYGNPPYGHAELSSVKTLCSRMGLDLEQSLKNLKAAEMQFDGENSTIITISKSNGITPQQVYELMQGNNNQANSPADQGSCSGTKVPMSSGQKKLSHGMGVGKMSVKDLCTKYNITTEKAKERLDQKGLKYSKGDKLKEIAEKNDISPFSVYEIVTDQ